MTLAFSNIQSVYNGGAGFGGAAIATAEFSTDGKCKAAQYDKGWRLGLFVGGMFVAVTNVAAFLFTKLV